MHPRRVFGLAAVFLKGVCAGNMDSRKGNAIVTPAPRKNVRRQRCFFVMNMTAPLNPRGAKTRDYMKNAGSATDR